MSGSRPWVVCATVSGLLFFAACDADGPAGPDALPPTITTTALATGIVGLSYAETLAATGGTPPYEWSVSSGTLPEGLALDVATGEISGTPTAPGGFAFVVQVRGSDGLSSTRSLSIAVEPPLPPLEITTDGLPDGVVGNEYAAVLEATGGDGSYDWSIDEGTLPRGLALAEGMVAGSPSEGGYFPVSLRATSGYLSATAELRIRVFETTVAAQFLAGVQGYIDLSIQYNQDLLPRNPHLASEIEAKIGLLSDPDLEAKILNLRLFDHAPFTKRDGTTIPVFIAFTADTMRAGALEDLSRIPAALASLEDFFQFTWPYGHVREWYGFRMGHTGGGGTLTMEDRGTYADRGVPHNAIIGHELGHSYIGHEALTQFLEVYTLNVAEAGSADFATWSYTRGEYVPFAAGNTGFRALLDIYQLVGPEAMGRAYRRIHSMGAPYGVPLSAAGRAAFVDEAPPEVRTQVAALVDRI